MFLEGNVATFIEVKNIIFFYTKNCTCKNGFEEKENSCKCKDIHFSILCNSGKNWKQLNCSSKGGCVSISRAIHIMGYYL